MTAAQIASTTGTSAGHCSNHAAKAVSWVSKSPQTASFFDLKYRKNVRRPMPAAAAISSTEVTSKPCSENIASEICSNSARLVTAGRPRAPWRSAAGWVTFAPVPDW